MRALVIVVSLIATPALAQSTEEIARQVAVRPRQAVIAGKPEEIARQVAEQARQDVIAGKPVERCYEPVANRDMVAVAQRYAAGELTRKQYETAMIRIIKTSRYLWEPPSPGR